MDHNLGQHFPDLARFESRVELISSDLWPRVEPHLEELLTRLPVGEFGPVRAASRQDRLRATAWNIERGSRLDGVIRALRHHPVLSESDVLLLTELDHGMARSGNRDVTRDLARELGFSFAFAPCYLSLVKGSGVEYSVTGENRESIHGNAILSRYPLKDPHSIALPNGKDKMSGPEKRLGQQRAVIATVDHPMGPVRCVSIHLDAQSSQRHRAEQMELILRHLDSLPSDLPVLLGGDWNTSTYNSSRALHAIAGYWLRLFMGPKRVIERHFPYPERLFERRLFQSLQAHGFSHGPFNVAGGCTVHYDIEDTATNAHLRDWVPAWCFWFMRQALRPFSGRCGLKLDWFAARGLELAPGSAPTIHGEVNRSGRLSDHDPIVVEVTRSP